MSDCLKSINKFNKLVAIEPVSLISSAEQELFNYAENVILYEDIPENDDEIIKRIGDADAVLLSYTSRINRHVFEQCPSIRYVGMCCSLYSEESANVDIAFARTKDITVTGIRDYGDRGLVEYVLYQLIRILHGFDYPAWKKLPLELTDLKVGILGLGVSGGMVADALHFMGADVSYYSRTRKQSFESKGISYQPLDKLLEQSQVICTCLNKNVILLHEEQFHQLGNGKILINTSIGPAFDIDALNNWLESPENLFCCDTEGAIGDSEGKIIQKENVICMRTSVGRTKQAFDLLSQKVLDNIKSFVEK